MDLIPDNVAGLLADIVLLASVLAAVFYIIKRFVIPFTVKVLWPLAKNLFRFGKEMMEEEE